jgi:hypothetical protein
MGLSRKKKNREDEPIPIYTWKCHKETPCIAIIKKKSQFFSFYKIREQEGRTGPIWGDWYQWEGEDMGRDCRRVNIVQILCTHVYKWKTETC